MARSERVAGRFFDQPDQQPLDHDRAVGAQIFDRLKLAILTMDIAPGSLISEVEIGRRFSASRTPVREALMRLREAGLVVTSAGRGNFATKLSEARLREAQFIRQILEIGIVEALCRTGLSEASRAAIENNLEDQRRNLSTENKHEFQRLDDEFHQALARATGVPRIAAILEREKMVLDRLRVLSLEDESHIEMLYGQHAGIFEAIASQDRKRAVAVMTDHLTSVLQTLSTLAMRHREYFE
ncbi:GntR family transcriptional regulator [Hoeflea prorocentri]|uniref:GntR family transcriptional regulator n=1 Tax=Hoeflea prorocentri TaxID=1922333 RepID=A0A9X3ZG39_9HYPH|nr:GntR family transcriptional regulator [Hoeflea prorocentri]MCY6379799.1 GntR family transcriptional regulator [Hoeflea prorocentri]MDA5397599.1 GntR family transcriptional regulator [Hoeflea prorocentri]